MPFRKALAGGVQKILEEVSYNKQTKGPDPQRAVKYAALLNATTTDAELAACDLVIEAIVENPEVKRQAVRAAGAAAARRCDSGVEHFDDSDHAAGRRLETAGAIFAAFTFSIPCERCRWWK